VLEEFPGEEAALSYDGMQVIFLSDRAALGLGSETDEQVFMMKRGVTKDAPITATIGSRMYYTLTLHHGDLSTLSADLTDPMPNNVTYVPDSVWASAGAAGYNAAQQQVTWSGDVAAGETVTVTFAVTPTCDAPPPPTRAENWATVNLGGKTYHPMAVTTIVLPEKDLTALADYPAIGAKDVRIESSGVGPLLRWHDQASSLTCGAGADDDVAYKVYLRKQEGSWQEVGTYPNCSRQVQLSKNDLSCQNNGDPDSYTWKVVTYDPMYPCREPVESPFNFSTASCRPELDVKPQLTLSPGYFLDNRPVDNVIKVEVDWNGPAYETPDTSPPYGDVYFDLNGKQSQESGQQWGAEHTYDMGRDFESSLSCANNTLQVWAINADGFEAEKGVIQPTIFPFPGWVDWLENLHLGEFNTEKNEPLVEYTYAFKYPEDPFEANWTPPGWIPYLGGHELGILETQAEANAVGKSDGSGSAGVSGQTGLGLGAVDVAGTLSGQGNAQFTCGESLDFTGAELNFGIHATIEQEAGLADVIPAARAAEKWPVVGRAIRWVNSIATLKATLTPGVDIKTEFEERSDQLEFVHGEGTGSIDIRTTLATEVCEDINASAYGGGTPYITIQVPQDPGYLKEVGIDVYYGATFQAWQFEREYERKINCHYPGGCSEVESSGVMAMAEGADWHLIPRDYAARPVLHASIALQATGITTETVLVSPAYARPEPALAVRADGRRLLAYIHDDTTKPHGRGAEIRALTWDGSNWSSTAVTADQQPDFAPAVAFEDGGDNGLVVWEHSTLPAAIIPTLDITFAQSLEIAYAVYTPTLGTWSAPVALTNDSLMDYAPRLSAGNDGAVLALWQTNDGNDILGTADHPLTYTYAIWDGGSWGIPAVALTGLHDVVGTAFAAYSSTQAALVYAVDADGLLTTTHDSDLYYATFDGAWSGPTRLMNDVITDTTPALAYDAVGGLHLLWLRGGNLVELTNSWDINDIETVRAASTEGGFLGFTLSRAPDGNLSLVWQMMGDEGADLAYSIHDAAAGDWGADQMLMNDADVEVAHSPAFAAGDIYLAYQKVATEFVTRTFVISPTYSFTVTNVPTPGSSSLVFLAHTIGRDLTFDELTLTPANPGAGQAVTLTAVLRNAGDLTVVAPQVAFYAGASQIGSTQTLSNLAAGYTATVQLNWTVPSPAAAHTLRAVADPGAQVTETNESNNEIATTATLPDLAVDLLYTTHDSEAITITARLVNAGVLAAAAPFDVAFRAADPLTGTLLGAVTVGDDLGAGEQVTVTLALTDTVPLIGLGDTLWAIADAGENVTEADEENNTEYAALNILPDLTLTAADIVGYGPITVTVHNAGVITATAPVIAVWQGGLTGTLLYSGTLGVLEPGGSQGITVTFAGDEAELWAKADPDNQIAESNEGNNLAVREVAVVTPDQMQIYLPLVLRNYAP
jgi:hypothetical protein